MFIQSRIVSILLTIPLVAGWSGEGHRIIVEVAHRLISERGVRYLENHLGEEDLVAASVWADTDDASTRYPESQEYHFSHTPYRDCQPFDLERDCGFPGKEGLCIVTGLADAIELATDPSIPMESRLDAIKFVLHFMGDIHQPLHTGFRRDHGGNDIMIGNMVNKTLHGIWDYDLVRRRATSLGSTESMIESISKSISSVFMDRIKSQADVASIVANGTSSQLVSYTALMATDTTMTSTCKLAYKNFTNNFFENGDFVSEEYLENRSVTVQVLLAKAAARLALLIDAIADVYFERLADRRAVAKQQAREARKLFEERERAAEILANKITASNPLYGNRFAVLAMEFDPIKLQWVLPSSDEDDDKGVGSEVLPDSSPSHGPTPSSKKSHSASAGKTKRDDREGMAILDGLVAERARNTFAGIHLPDVVLVVKYGLNIVTTMARARMPNFKPDSISPYKVEFSGNRQEDRFISFYFDAEVFPPPIQVELVVRCILKIRGITSIDGRSDLSSFWTNSAALASGASASRDEATIASVEVDHHRPASAVGKRSMADGKTGYGLDTKTLTEKQIKSVDRIGARALDYLRHQAAVRGDTIDLQFRNFISRQSKRRSPATIDDFWIEKIGQIKDEIITLNTGRIMMIALSSTLSKTANRLRFNSFDVHPTDKGMKADEHVIVLVDPNIFDGHLSHRIYEALAAAIDKSKGGVVLIRRPTIMDELADLHNALTGTDPDRLGKLKAIQFIMMFYTQVRPSWGHPNYRVTEWATKAAPFTVFDPPADFEPRK